jgi:thiamine-phosphate pyrophosphorylase
MHSKSAIDYSVYFVADSTVRGNRTLPELVEMALSGGATIIQLRHKTSSSREFLNDAVAIKRICNAYGVPFIVNDRIDIALAVDADGVHIGQDDIPLSTARRLTGDKKIIGVSASCADEAILAEKEGADYIGAGAVFATLSKPDAGKPIGFDGLSEIARAVNIPVVAIGGINRSNARQCFNAGAMGVAVISAISLADNPKISAMELKKSIVQSG